MATSVFDHHRGNTGSCLQACSICRAIALYERKCAYVYYTCWPKHTTFRTRRAQSWRRVGMRHVAHRRWWFRGTNWFGVLQGSDNLFVYVKCEFGWTADSIRVELIFVAFRNAPDSLQNFLSRKNAFLFGQKSQVKLTTAKQTPLAWYCRNLVGIYLGRWLEGCGVDMFASVLLNVL